MEIYTIGFTKKTAEQFFTKLRESGARRIVDVRLGGTGRRAPAHGRRLPPACAPDAADP